MQCMSVYVCGCRSIHNASLSSSLDISALSAVVVREVDPERNLLVTASLHLIKSCLHLALHRRSFADFRNFGFAEFRKSGNPEVRKSGNQDFRNSRNSGFPEIPEIRNAGNPEMVGVVFSISVLTLIGVGDRAGLCFRVGPMHAMSARCISLYLA